MPRRPLKEEGEATGSNPVIGATAAVPATA